MLIDTGSMVTIVRSSLVREQSLPTPERDPEVVLRSASGHEIPISRQAIVHFEMGEDTIEHNALLCPQLYYDAIIGYDFIQEHITTIDAANQVIWLSPTNKIRLEPVRGRPINQSMGLQLIHSDIERNTDNRLTEKAEDRSEADRRHRRHPDPLRKKEASASGDEQGNHRKLREASNKDNQNRYRQQTVAANRSENSSGRTGMSDRSQKTSRKEVKTGCSDELGWSGKETTINEIETREQALIGDQENHSFKASEPDSGDNSEQGRGTATINPNERWEGAATDNDAESMPESGESKAIPGKHPKQAPQSFKSGKDSPPKLKDGTTPEDQGLDQIDTGTLGSQERQTLLRLIKSHSDCFSWDGELGTCELIEHHIDLTSDRPIRRPAYQIPHSQREFIESEVREMLQKGVIEPSVSPYSAGVVLVPKKTGELRFCVDYRGLNEVTRPDHYPLPIAHNEIFDTLGEATIFSCLDCQQGYWQVKVAKEDRPKTAFRCFLGLYQFRKLPFGLRTAPATYQRLMSHVLSGYIGRFCHCFIDDIICFSRDFEEHLEHLQLIFNRLREANIKLKPSKCVFAKESVTYLGHRVSVGELRPDPGNVEKIQDLPIPTTRREVRSFIGMAAYYRCFVQDFSRRAKPLTDLTKKHASLEWGPEQDHAFNDLKTALTSEPVLALPDFSRPFILMTDGSSTGLGAVLGQRFEGDSKERVIGYASRRTTSGEEKFSACELECLALIWAVKHFRTYILGRETTVVTDHWALKWLLDLKTGNPRLQRWRIALQEYDLRVVHKPAHMHRNADFLSRMYEKQVKTGGPEGGETPLATCRSAGETQDTARPNSLKAMPSGDDTLPKRADRIRVRRSEDPSTDAPEDDQTREGAEHDERKPCSVPMGGLAEASPRDRVSGEEKFTNAVQTRKQARESQARQQVGSGDGGVAGAEQKSRSKEGFKNQEPLTGTKGDTKNTPTSQPLRDSPALPEETVAGPGRQRLRAQQEEDPDCREVMQATKTGTPLPKWACGGEFWVAPDGVLEKIDCDAVGTARHRPVLPAGLVKTAVQDAHAGHLKLAKTLAKLRERFYFKHMHGHCAKYIEGCETCQEKDRGRKLKAPLGTLPKPWGAWHTVAVDVLGPLPQTRLGNKYVILITDYLTRFVIALAVKDQTAETTAGALMQKFLEFGFPARLITDNGPNFRSRLMEQFCTLLETAHLFTTPYHPQFDGLCERFNRTLASMLRGFVASHQGDWDLHLPYVMYAYRTAVQESTRESPFFLMFGRPPREPLDLLYRLEEDPANQPLTTKPAMVVRMHKAFDHVQAHLQEAHARQKRYHDQGSKDRSFKVGDEVMLLDERVQVGQTKKLHPPWKPGYRVIERVGPLNFRIEHPNKRGRVLRVHIDRLKIQKPSYVWPLEQEEPNGKRDDRSRQELSPLDKWLQEERRRHRPFHDHWSSLEETEDGEGGSGNEEREGVGLNQSQRDEPLPITPRAESPSLGSQAEEIGRIHTDHTYPLPARKRALPSSRQTSGREEALGTPIIRRSERIRIRRERKNKNNTYSGVSCSRASP